MKIYDLLFADGSIFITVPTNDPKEELKRAQINFPVVSYREVVEPELTLEELKENKRLEMEREKLELDKRLTDAQIRKIEKETDDDKAVSVKIEFDAVTEEGGWAK